MNRPSIRSFLPLLLALLLSPLASCSSNPEVPSCGASDKCDDLISHQAKLWIVSEPDLQIRIMALTLAQEPFELNTDEADMVRKTLESQAIRVFKRSVPATLMSSLKANFKSVGFGPASEMPADTTYRVVVSIAVRETVREALLPDIQLTQDGELVEIGLSMIQEDAGSAPLRLELKVADNIYEGLSSSADRLNQSLMNAPIFSWKSLGHLARFTSGSLGDDPTRVVLTNPKAVFDDDPNTRTSLTVQYTRKVDTFLGLFGDYDFDPVYLQLSFDQPVPLNYFVLEFAKGAGTVNGTGRQKSYSVKVYVSNLQDPGPPSINPQEWAYAGRLESFGETNQYYSALNGYRFTGKPSPYNHSFSEIDRETKARHIAVVWSPPVSDDDGTKNYELNTFNLYAPPDEVWNDWFPPSRGGGGGGGGGGCFTAGTQISTPSGAIAIEEVKLGDTVWSYDTDNNQVVQGTVERLFVRNDYPNGTLKLSDGREVHTTPDHPFFRERNMSVVASRYDEENNKMQIAFAEELLPGETVYVLDEAQEQTVPLTVVDSSFDAKPTTVYNFTVTGSHSYFAEGILVHNR